MDDKRLFTQHYSTDTSKYEDKPEFRTRALMYLEDVVNSNWPQTINHECRSRLGINIEAILKRGHLPHQNREHYLVEQKFAEQPIGKILNFIGVCFETWDSAKDHNPSITSTLDNYLQKINSIFQEESMLYVLHSDGRVRYFPDEEFHQLTKSTLTILNKPKYRDNLKAFNVVLDDFYKNRNTESPIDEFFKCLETFALSMLNDKKYNRLSADSIKELMKRITDKTKLDATYTDNDNEALTHFNDTLLKFVSMCHKYRHGKPGLENKHVPPPLFNYISSLGISTFRFLLELDDTYQLIPNETT